jgi:hypothetical protein
LRVAGIAVSDPHATRGVRLYADDFGESRSGLARSTPPHGLDACCRNQDPRSRRCRPKKSEQRVQKRLACLRQGVPGAVPTTASGCSPEFKSCTFPALSGAGNWSCSGCRSAHAVVFLVRSLLLTSGTAKSISAPPHWPCALPALAFRGHYTLSTSRLVLLRELIACAACAFYSPIEKTPAMA